MFTCIVTQSFYRSHIFLPGTRFLNRACAIVTNIFTVVGVSYLVAKTGALFLALCRFGGQCLLVLYVVLYTLHSRVIFKTCIFEIRVFGEKTV